MPAFVGTLRRTIDYQVHLWAKDKEEAHARLTDVADLADPSQAEHFVEGVIGTSFDGEGNEIDDILLLEDGDPDDDPFCDDEDGYCPSCGEPIGEEHREDCPELEEED